MNETNALMVEALKEGLKSDLEIEVMLCQIAIGNVNFEEIKGGSLILRGASPTERVKAADLIFKKRGSYAPVKSEVAMKGITLIEQEPDKTDAPIN